MHSRGVSKNVIILLEGIATENTLISVIPLYLEATTNNL